MPKNPVPNDPSSGTAIDFGQLGSQAANPVSPQSAPTASEQRAAASRVQNAKDIWNLGDLYGREVYLGDSPPVSGVQSPGTGTAGAELGMGESSPEQPAFGQTQQFMQQVSQLWTVNPAGYQALQAELAQAGYYGSTGKYVPGRFDSATQSALKGMLQDYETGVISAKIPMTVDEFLSQNATATVAAQQSAASAPVATHVSLTDPDTIRQSAIAAFEQAVGKRPTDKQLDAFVEKFQAQQAGAQTTEEKARAAGQSSAMTTPDLSTQATAYAQSADPQAYQNYKASAYENALVNMFVPSESQRANITPTPAA